MSYVIKSHDGYYFSRSAMDGLKWIKSRSNALRFELEQSAQCVIDLNKYAAKVVDLDGSGMIRPAKPKYDAKYKDYSESMDILLEIESIKPNTHLYDTSTKRSINDQSLRKSSRTQAKRPSLTDTIRSATVATQASHQG